MNDLNTTFTELTTEQLRALSLDEIKEIIHDKRLYLQTHSSQTYHAMIQRHKDERDALNNTLRKAYVDLETDGQRLIEDWKAARDDEAEPQTIIVDVVSDNGIVQTFTTKKSHENDEAPRDE